MTVFVLEKQLEMEYDLLKICKAVARNIFYVSGCLVDILDAVIFVQLPEVN